MPALGARFDKGQEPLSGDITEAGIIPPAEGSENRALIRTAADHPDWMLCARRWPAAQPDCEHEMLEFLSQETDFDGLAPLIGTLTLMDPSAQSGFGERCLFWLRQHRPHQGNLRRGVMEQLARLAGSHGGNLAAWHQDAAALAQLGLMHRLGQRLAALHACLAAARNLAAFIPEPVESAEWRLRERRIQDALSQAMQALQQGLGALPEPVRLQAQALLEQRDPLGLIIQTLSRKTPVLRKQRIHGQLRLSHCLVAENDLLFDRFGASCDKQLVLQDLATLILSIHLTVAEALELADHERPGEHQALEAAFEDWAETLIDTVLAGYREHQSGKDMFDAKFSVATSDWLTLLLIQALSQEILQALKQPVQTPGLSVQVKSCLQALMRLTTRHGAAL